MGKKVYIFLAEGFEEIEGLTVVDLMRRAGIDIVTVSITDQPQVTSSHRITLQTDTTFAETDFSDADMLVLPGGMPGTTNLGAYEPLTTLLKEFDKKGGKLAAICAAPTIFAQLGLLNGKKATSFPKRENDMAGAVYLTDSVVVDGNITTSRGMGTSVDFGLSLIGQLLGQEKAEEIAGSIVYNR